jgi:hypothetical protein
LKTELKMIKKILHIILYSTILFCVFSFLSLSVSIIYSKFNNLLPTFTMGFPFEMYTQFEVGGECNERTLLYGSHLINVLYNLFSCIIISTLMLFRKTIKKTLFKPNFK